MDAIRREAEKKGEVVIFHFTNRVSAGFIVKTGLRMSTQGQGDGGVYFITMGPISFKLGSEAFERLIIENCFGKERMDEYKAAVGTVRQREADMRAGLDIFNIEPPANQETADTERNLELLATIWGEIEDWNTNMDGWKYGAFATMDVNAIENTAGTFNKRILKLYKEFKGTNQPWKVLDDLKNRVEGIKKLFGN